MKITRFFAVLTVLCGLSLSSVTAQDGDKPERPKRGQRDGDGAKTDRPERPGRPERGRGPAEDGAPGIAQMLRRLPLMMALDADSDGTLSAKEIEGAAAALKKLDKDGDGKITMAELAPRGMGPGGPGGPGGPAGLGGGEGAARLEQMFVARDANGDGKLTDSEIPEMLQGRMERVDENGDGAIEKSELVKAMSRMGRGDRPAGDRPNGDRPKDGSGVKPKRPGSDN